MQARWTMLRNPESEATPSTATYSATVFPVKQDDDKCCFKKWGGGRLFDKFKNCSETHLHISLFQDSQILKNANVLCVSPEERQRIQCNKNIFDHQNTSFSFK